MTEFVELGHIDKITSTFSSSTDTFSSQLELDKYLLLQEVLDTSKVTNEVTETLNPIGDK